MDVKQCTKCKQDRPGSEFTKNSSRPGGVSSWCKGCLQRWKSDNPDKVRESRRRSQIKCRYGLTPEQYDQMVEEVGGKCPVCLRAPDYAGQPRRLAVDHDHQTGRIRGLLCWRCNGAVGIIGEENLHRLLEYLAAAEDRQ